MSAIRLENVRKHWDAAHAVDDISFTVEEGTLLVLLGPSGCGKSTTLRLIAGLEQVSSGRIFIGGKDVTYAPPARRGLSMVFQSYALFPHMTVRENILFGLTVRKVAPDERKRRLDKAVEILGLGGLLERKPSALSGGQQQRVALGRALVAEATVCLMDEPLSNLDAKLRLEMRREIRALQQRIGMTMVYVTHDQTEAMSMADTIILMKQGRIEQNDAPAALYARPATTFAAGFIGSPPMNLMALAMREGKTGVSGFDGGRLPRAATAEHILGIRPERAVIRPDGEWKATVESMEYLGADSVVICRIGDQRIAVQTAGWPNASPGDVLNLHFPEDALHFFDAHSGRRAAMGEATTA